MKRTTLLLPPSTSTLLPRTTNGKFSGSEGLAWEKFIKPSFHRTNSQLHIKPYIKGWVQILLQILMIQYLNKEFFPPVVEIIKWFLHIHIIHKDTAICTTVKSNSKALKPFLSGSIPDLQEQKFNYIFRPQLTLNNIHILCKETVSVYKKIQLHIHIIHYNIKRYNQNNKCYKNW